MSLSSRNFEFVRQLLHQEAAVVLQPDKEYFVERRLESLGAAYERASADQVVEMLRNAEDRELRTRVVESLLVHETSFFRDPGLMSHLADTVIPDLVQKRSGARSLRIWCAACSTGQEPYTVSMLLQEYLDSPADWDIRILASDVSGQALARGRDGRYSITDVNRGLPVRLLVRYFEQQGLAWQVNARTRSMVDFRQINLVESWPEMPVFDLVLLRNVLIYFGEDSRQTVLERLHGQLAGDGYLVLGGTERIVAPRWQLARQQAPSPFYQPVAESKAS